MSEIQERKRLSGGFWRRAIAAMIDWLIVGVALTALAKLAYGPTGGQLRISRPVFNIVNCQAVHDVRGAPVPAGFRIDDGQLCVTTLFGREVDRYLILAQRTGTATSYRTETVVVPVTPAMKTLKPHYLDADLGMVLLVLMTIFEVALLTTPGKALLGLRLVGVAGERPSIWGCWGRNTSLYLGWVLAGFPGLAQMANFKLQFNPDGTFAYTYGTTPFSPLGAVVLVMFLAPQIAMIFQRPDPFYDQWAGIRVVRR